MRIESVFTFHTNQRGLILASAAYHDNKVYLKNFVMNKLLLVSIIISRFVL